MTEAADLLVLVQVAGGGLQAAHGLHLLVESERVGFAAFDLHRRSRLELVQVEALNCFVDYDIT